MERPSRLELWTELREMRSALAEWGYTVRLPAGTAPREELEYLRARFRAKVYDCQMQGLALELVSGALLMSSSLRQK